MADVNLKPGEVAERGLLGGSRTRVAAPLTAEERPEIALIELLFFAYRDFVGDPDRINSIAGRTWASVNL